MPVKMKKKHSIYEPATLTYFIIFIFSGKISIKDEGEEEER